MTCIYKKSKYYQQAVLDPLNVIEPIGYKYLQQTSKPKIAFKKKEGEAIIKSVNDHSLTKQLSQRSAPLSDVEKYLKITESNQRKNFNLNGQNLQFVNQNLTPQNMQALRSAYFPTINQKTELLSFLELVGAIYVLKEQAIFSIKDYALSTYLLYYQGENPSFYSYIQKIIDEEFIEYDNQILINSPQLARPQLRKIDYNNKDKVANYINEIMHIGKEKDPLFGGVHFYISDQLPQIKDQTLVREESQLWSYLQFQITVITGILNQGQHAVLKIGGSFTQKTVQYLFLLKLAFSRLYFHKNSISNPFTNDKYLVCEGFNKENGRMISQFLLNNYQDILQKGQNVLIVQLKALYMNEFHTYINDFNNLSPVIKTSKEVFTDFSQNCNISFFPNRENLLKKIEKLRLFNLEEVQTTLETLIPESSEKKKTQKQPLIIQKQAELFDFEAMGKLCQPSSESKQPTKKLYDLSAKKQDPNEDYIKKYLSNGDYLLKVKKQQARKKKQKEKEEKQQM